MKLTVLSDNEVYVGPLLTGEPGFSLLVEDGDAKVLLDTGWSGSFLENARRLGVCLSDLTHIVFSHGHNDHTAGFPALAAQEDLSRVTLLTHPRAFANRTPEDNFGPPFTREEASRVCRLQLSEQPVNITETLTYLGSVPRLNGFENREPLGLIEEDGRMVPDYVPDDSALVWHGTEGLFVMTGCAHSGICNTLEYACTVCGDKRIAGVIGGFHLLARDARLTQTAEYFRNRKIPYFCPCHCTCFAARAALNQVLPVTDVGVGFTLTL